MAHYSSALPHSHFLSNPLINKLNRVEEKDSTHACSYGGIAFKSLFFLIMLVAGVVLYFPLHVLFTGPTMEVMGAAIPYSEAGVLVACLLLTALTPTLAFLIRPILPLAGILYCAGTGYLLSFAVNTYAADFTYPVWLALVITLLLVAVMTILYTTRIIKVTEKFTAVVKTLFFTVILGGIAYFIGGFIPALQPAMKALQENLILGIVSSVVFIIIACMFLLVDFASVQHAVERQLPKKYEWLAAFSLVFTVIWLYLKVLNLILRLTSKQNQQKAA